VVYSNQGEVGVGVAGGVGWGTLPGGVLNSHCTA
jgi:hypothetical protein